MADNEAVKKMLRSVLQSSKNGVPITSLQAEYVALCGETIPVKKLGFSSLEGYLRSMPSVVRIEWRLGCLVCFAAVCKETAHIAELVARQKTAKKAGRSQIVNCKMRFKPSNPYALNVKPKTSLRQPSNWFNWSTNRRPTQGYGVCSASGDVRTLNQQSSSFVPVHHRPPLAPVTRNNYVVNNQENCLQIHKSQVLGIQSPTKEKSAPPVQVNKRPTEFNLQQEQTRLGVVLSVYSSGLWMSKLQGVYLKMFNQEPHPQTLLELEKWTHICSLENPSITNRADRLIYPSSSTTSCTTYRNINSPRITPISPVSTQLSSRPSSPEKPPIMAKTSVPQPRGVPRNPLTKPTFVFPPKAMDDGLSSVGLHSPPLSPALQANLVKKDFGSFNSPATNGSHISWTQPTPPSTPLVQPGTNVLSLLKATFSTNSDLPPDKPPVSTEANTLQDIRPKIKELLLKYRSGLWVHALPKLFEDTFKMPLPENALDDLLLWRDICSIEYPVPNNKTKAILYYPCRNERETPEGGAHPLPSGLEVVGSIVPPRLAPPSEQYPSVLITDAKSSNAVTVRYVGKNYSNAQEAMEEEMRSFYRERSSVGLSKVTIGQLVAVKGEDEEEEEMVRAQVMEVLSPHKVEVYYLDYGCSVQTNTHNLRELHQQFLSLPFQSINVKLAGVEHFSSHFVVLNTLEKEAVGKILLMETLEPDEHDVPLVILYDTSQDEDININSSCLKALQDETMNNPLTINVTYQDVCVSNVCANGIIHCQLPSRGMARLCKLFEEIEAFFQTQVTSHLLVSRPFSGKLCLARFKGKWSRVEVINVYGSRVLEILLIDYGVTVTIEVTELRDIPLPFVKYLTVIPPQVVRCKLEGVEVPEGGWSPEALKCLKEVVLGPEAVKMKILKLGEHEGNRLVYMHLFVGTDSLEDEDSISHQLAQSELWQKLVMKQISNSNADKGLSALVERLSLKNVTPLVNISQTKGSSEAITSKTDPQTAAMPSLIALPQPGQNMDVFVPVACHPGYFVLQPWQDLHKLVVLMGEMVLYYNKTPKTKSQAEIKKGDICAAKVDKNWHRVFVKGILSNGLVSVYDLDHGKHELVRNTAIQPLIEEFRQLPFQAITAQLAGLSRLQWSEEVSMIFRNHVEKRALVAQVDSVEEAPDFSSAPWERRLTVYLVDTTMEDRDLWIHTVMGDVGSHLSTAA